MKQRLKVEGMTCSGCVAGVTYGLQSIGQAKNVEVDLQSGIAEFEVEEVLPLETIRSAFPTTTKYRFEILQGEQQPSKTESLGRLKTFWPLILIGLFLSGISTMTTLTMDGNWMTWMNHFMGGFFIVFSFFKFLDIQGFANSYSGYDLLAMRWKSYGYVYPFIELGLGFGWAFGGGTQAVALTTLVVMGFSALGVIKAVLNKRSIACACLGTVFQLPMTTVTIVEDLIMVAMAGAVLLEPLL